MLKRVDAKTGLIKFMEWEKGSIHGKKNVGIRAPRGCLDDGGRLRGKKHE